MFFALWNVGIWKCPVVFSPYNIKGLRLWPDSPEEPPHKIGGRVSRRPKPWALTTIGKQMGMTMRIHAPECPILHINCVSLSGVLCHLQLLFSKVATKLAKKWTHFARQLAENRTPPKMIDHGCPYESLPPLFEWIDPTLNQGLLGGTEYQHWMEGIIIFVPLQAGNNDQVDRLHQTQTLWVDQIRLAQSRCHWCIESLKHTLTLCMYIYILHYIYIYYIVHKYHNMNIICMCIYIYIQTLKVKRPYFGNPLSEDII